MRDATPGMICLMMLFLTPFALSCSLVEVSYGTGKNLSSLIARTMELSGNHRYEVTVYPKDAVNHAGGVTSGGYGFVSIDLVLGIDYFPTEGMNQFGLTISAQTLAESVYQDRSNHSYDQIGYEAVVARVLRNATNVKEALFELQHLVVVSKIFGFLGEGVHWAISDAFGQSVVVEYLNGRLGVHDNIVGVLTNDPPYDWHLRNLNNHVNLQKTWPTGFKGVQVETESGPIPRVVGHGFNLAGIPGDSSPPSRFTRLFYLRQYAQSNYPAKTIDDAIVIATGLVNNVHIIKGTVAQEKRTQGWELVAYAVLKSPELRTFSYRSYTDPQWKKVDLNRLNFEGRSIVRIPIPSGVNVKDVTADFMHA